MAIKIYSTKIVPGNGIPSRKITKIEAMAGVDLPDLYNDHGPACYLGTNWGKTGLIAQPGKKKLVPDSVLWIEDIISEKKYQAWKTFIQACGDRLMRINQRLTKQREEWKGEEVDTI